VSIEVTVRDTETGETDTKTITDDFVIVTAGRHYVSNVQSFSKTGTVQVTVRVKT
jgi:hypothetical protein